MTTTGASQVGSLDPYNTVQAETICRESGIETEVCSEGGLNIGFIENGDWVMVKGVDFGTGAASFEARVSSETGGGNIEIRLDSESGTLVGTCPVPVTGGWQTWETSSCTVSGASGKHDVYLKFTGGSNYLFNVNWWKFSGGGNTTPEPTASPGDVNSDNTIDIVDALLIAQAYVGLDPANYNPAYADTNCDGTVDIVDALLTAQYYVGLIGCFCL
jgi:arabinoxylan arabinofuranohydrolase